MPPRRHGLAAAAAAAAALLLRAAAAPPAPFVLDFLPAPAENGFRNASLWSWGGGVVRGSAGDAQLHLFFSAFVGGCGLGAWGSNSAAFHAVAPGPLGPFELVGRALPFFSHNVAPLVAPDGTLLVFKIGMWPEPEPAKCSASDGGSSSGGEGVGSGHGFETVEAWWAPSVDGPFSPVAGGAPNGRNLFNGTNPAPAFDPSLNGTIYVMSHSSSAFLVSAAPSWHGPYSAPVAVFSSVDGDYVGEDPTLWFDAATRNGDGSVGAWHCLYHMYNASDTKHQFRVGGHAQSTTRSIFSPWAVQGNAAPAYTTNFTAFASGTGGPTATTTFARRERPKLFFAAAGAPPSVLYSGVCPQASGNDCFTIAAPIAPGGAR